MADEKIARWRLIGKRPINGRWYLMDLGDSNPNMRESPFPFFKKGVELILEGLESGDPENSDLKLGIEMLPPELLREGQKSSPAKFLYLLRDYDPRFAGLTERMTELFFRVTRISKGHPLDDKTRKINRYLDAHPEIGELMKSGVKGARKDGVNKTCSEVFGTKYTDHRPHVRRTLNKRYPVKPKAKN